MVQFPPDPTEVKEERDYRRSEIRYKLRANWREFTKGPVAWRDYLKGFNQVSLDRIRTTRGWK